MDTIAFAMQAPGDFFDKERRGYARLRDSVIAANGDERDLIKLPRLSAVLAERNVSMTLRHPAW